MVSFMPLPYLSYLPVFMALWQVNLSSPYTFRYSHQPDQPSASIATQQTHAQAMRRSTRRASSSYSSAAAAEEITAKPDKNRQTHGDDDQHRSKRARRAATPIIDAKPEALATAPSGIKAKQTTLKSEAVGGAQTGNGEGGGVGGGEGGSGGGEEGGEEGGAGGPSAYELERLENMKRNALVMASLGLGNAKAGMRSAVKSEAAQRARSRGLPPRQPKAYPPRSRCDAQQLQIKHTNVRGSCHFNPFTLGTMNPH